MYWRIKAGFRRKRVGKLVVRQEAISRKILDENIRYSEGKKKMHA